MMLALAAPASGALAAGSYYVGTSVQSNSVIWIYAPTTNSIKLCYSTLAKSLACTATKPALAVTPATGDTLQYRISQNSLTGGLWILDLTSNQDALCEAAIPASAYIVTCTRGTGVK